MEKIIIAAVSENGVIGKEGDIPWRYPEDLKHFRNTTIGYPVVMGSKTYLSLPDDHRPLQGRKNIVLTRSGIEVPEEVELANSLEEAWSLVEDTGKQKVFVIGGASIYEQVLPEADKMLITRIHREYDGDTYFPDWKEENWREVERDDRDEFSLISYRRK